MGMSNPGVICEAIGSWQQMSQGDKTLWLLHELHSDAIEMSRKLLFDKTHPQHLHVIALYGSILEFSSSIILLTKDGPKTALPIILRSLLEAYVDMLNLCADPKYGYALEVGAEKSWLKFLREAGVGQNPYLEKVSATSNLQDNIKQHEQRLAAMKEKGGAALRIEDKFKRAGLMHEYTTIYAELCSHSHNALQALRGRHIEETESNYEIVFYRLASLDEVEHYLGIACMLLLKATERVHIFLGNPCVGKLSEMGRRMDVFVKEHEAA